jgi:hypothetical protein
MVGPSYDGPVAPPPQASTIDQELEKLPGSYVTEEGVGLGMIGTEWALVAGAKEA